MHADLFLSSMIYSMSFSCVIKWKIMLPLYNDQISLLAALAVIHGSSLQWPPVYKDHRNFVPQVVVIHRFDCRLDKTSENNLTNLTDQFKLFEAETQQKLTSFPEHFLDIQKGIHLRKRSPNLGSSLLSHRSKHTRQKICDIDKNSDFIINLLKDNIS